MTELSSSPDNYFHMQAPSIKEEAKRLIESLPDNSTWSDVMYEIYVRREIEAGLNDLEAGRSRTHEEVKQLFADRK
jgi:predicted transcriptional regulator